MLEARHLRLVKAVAEEGSLTRAGQRLHLTQSALSHQLLALEDDLGTRLFERLRKKMVPTPAGERLLQSAQSVLAELDRAAEEIRAGAQGRKGVLRLATQCNTVYHWLPARLQIYQRHFPDVAVQVVAGATQDPVSFLMEGKLDLAVMHGTVRDRALRLEPLFEDEMVALVHPRHPLAQKLWLSPEDFRNEHLISYTEFRQSLVYQQFLRPAGVMPARATNVQLSEAIVEMVKAGMGVGILVRWSVTPYVRAGQIVARGLTAEGFHRQWSAAMLRTAPPFVRGFADVLKRYPIPEWRTPRQASRALKAMFQPVARRHASRPS